MVSSIDDETDLSLNKWGDVNDDEHTLKILDEELEVYQLTENIMVLVNTLPNMRYKMRFQRIATDEKTLAERMVGKWSLSKRYAKANGVWTETIGDYPLECWSDFTESGVFTTYTRWPAEEWKTIICGGLSMNQPVSSLTMFPENGKRDITAYHWKTMTIQW